MASLTDYLTWRGELTFEEAGLNEVDAVLLALVSYVDLSGIIGDGCERVECTLAEAAELFWKLHTKKEINKSVSTAVRDAGSRLAEMAQTARYKDLILRNYVNIIDDNKEEQFSAVEIVLGKKLSFVSFSGTDDTLVGWKEDFNLCYLMPVPAQTDSVTYLEGILRDTGNKVYIGGHSKGGNLAVYAGTMCKKGLFKQIITMYNFDGPGFNRDFVESDRYQDRRVKIESRLPECSIVGLLMEHCDDYLVVKSSYSGFMQHDANSWEVLGSHFITVPKVKDSSMRLSLELRKWMSELSPAELEEFGEAVYAVMTATKAKTLVDMTQDMVKSVTTVMRSYNTMDKQAKKMLMNLIKLVIKANTGTGVDIKEN